MISLLAAALLSQDLFEREASLRRRLPPGPDFAEVKPVRASLDLSAGPDFACGNFDLKASFTNLFDRNVREEFLGSAFSALQSELAGSALVLACYASPTVCDAIKHYRVSANAMLGMEFDACRAVEQALGDVRRQSKARAIKECLDEKAGRGVPLDRARRECLRAAEIRGFDGKPAKEIDLLKELGVPELLAQPLRLGAGVLRAEARPTAVVEAYQEKRRRSLDEWAKALADSSKASLDDLGPLSRGEVERIASMEPARRDAVVRTLASAKALSDLLKEVHGVERALEKGELLGPPEVRAELERRRVQLRSEMARLQESFDMERRLAAAVTEAQAVAEADLARKVGERLARPRAASAARAAEERFKPWGCDAKK